jgi:superfamily I DNA/RNA helicase
LVRDVLKNGTINPIHPVIFCDEVQDFTQIELNVIFCLSPWGKYKLDWTIERLPYAFAGDPLQTINPTGFRWAALKKYLHEHIHAYLLPGHPFEIQSPQDLKNNYRSSPQITRFSNVVNLWRRILSNNREITPQLPWRPQEQGRLVQKLVLDGQGQNLTDGELKNMLSTSTGTVCILPCCVGEELSYVAQDPKLQKIFVEELAQNLKPAQLQTVTAVKGMEFKKIILYKFGDYYQQNFKKQLKHYAQGTENQVSLQLQYFLNQLYVGITRPIEALAIMDTSCGWQKFWEPNLATDFWLNHPSLKQDQSQWQTHPPVLNSTTESIEVSSIGQIPTCKRY